MVIFSIVNTDEKKELNTQRHLFRYVVFIYRKTFHIHRLYFAIPKNMIMVSAILI